MSGDVDSFNTHFSIDYCSYKLNLMETYEQFLKKLQQKSWLFVDMVWNELYD